MSNFRSKEKVRVLVVEDSATQAERLRYILEKDGYEVFVAGNGRAALEKLRGTNPSVVISDIIMPEMDGFRLCRQMKSDENLKGIPLILLTALSDPKDVLKGLECGADNFITKPYDAEYLLSKLRHVLSNSAGCEKGSTLKGIEILFQGEEYLVTSGRRQMLDLLLSSYETAVAKNQALMQAQEKLEGMNAQLEKNVENIRTQNAIQKAINRILHETMTCETPEQLGVVCLAVLEDLTQSEVGFIGEVGTDGLLHDIAISNPGWDLCRMKDSTGHRKPLGNFMIRGIYGRVLLDGKSVRSNHPASHPDSIGLPSGHPPLNAFLGVPLLADDRVIGMVGLGNRQGGYWEEQQQAVETVAPAMVQALLRKKTEQALKQSEARFRLLSGTAGQLLRSSDPLTIVKELCRQVMEHLDCHVFFNFLVNEETGRLRLNACAGIPEEEIRKIQWLDYGVAVCGCVARDGVRMIAEDILHTPDPRTDLVKSYGVQAYCCHPLMAQGKLIGTLSFGTRTRTTFAPDEITLMKSVADQVAVAMQRLKAAQALRISEEKLRSAFANAAIGFAITTPAGRFVDANPAYCTLTGYNVEELRDLNVRHLIHPDDLAGNDTLIERVLAGEISDFVLENRSIRKDGSTVWVRRSISLVRDSDGEPQRILLLVEDIATQKRAEEELRNALAQLQDHARRLQESNRELESFAYSVSHDLRAPLRAISGFTRMIFDEQGDSFDPETRRKFGVVQENADKMDRLIEGLLGLSRLSRTEMRRSTIDLSKLVREVMEEIKMTESERTVNVKLGALPPLHGDPTLIRQLMMNLLSNAVKFTRRKETPIIEVGSRKETNGLVYYVADNGVGFDMEYYEKLFGVFQRLVSESQFEGTGVGLAIAQRIVQRHGGRIWAEGKPQKGATFYFSFPDRID